jgi:hypothetical protein
MPPIARGDVAAPIERRARDLFGATVDCVQRRALGHHFDEISVRESVPEVQAHAQYDDLGIEMAALEELVEAQ